MLRTQSLAYKLGVKIRTLRKAAGLTQKQLAEAADVSTNFIGYVEHWQRALSIKTLERIAQVLNVTPRDLFEYSEGQVRELLYETLLPELRKCTIEDLRALPPLVERLSRQSPDRFIARRNTPVAKQGGREKNGVDGHTYLSRKDCLSGLRS